MIKVENDDTNLRGVRISHFPVYSELRQILPVWSGRPRKQVTDLIASINELTGTPEKPVDSTDPTTWIPERQEP